MKLGLFLMPSHPPERGLLAGQQWDLAVLREADRLGYSEAWIGEHFTSRWEPNPAPDLLIAQALMQTQPDQARARCPSSALSSSGRTRLPRRLMDHLAEGRYMLGIGASGLPSDWQLFCVDGMKGVNREMTREALDIMLKVWASDGGLRVQGQVLERERAGSDAAHAGPSYAPAAAAASAYRNRRPQSRIGNAQARRRARFHAAQSQHEPRLRRHALGGGARRRAAQRRTPEPARLADRARDFRRRHRRRSASQVASAA